MEPETQNEESNRTKRIIVILLAVITLCVLAGAAYWFFMMRGTAQTTTSSGGVLPFGTVGSSIRTAITGGGTTQIVGGGSGGEEKEPLFRQLTDVPVAGAIAIEKNGEQYIRYMEREAGHVIDVRLRDGDKTLMTNKTIPRVHEAYFGLGGDAVIARSLEEDAISKQDIIKSTLGYITPPTGDIGVGSLDVSLQGLLPDNIPDISISPNGKTLFYLTRNDEGVMGTKVDLATKIFGKTFQNSFIEWTPQILNSGDILLTTKPSAEVEGFSYRYNSSRGTLERILRNKFGMTMLPNAKGVRVLFEENIAGRVLFGVWNGEGFKGDEGIVSYENALSLVTLPEKCVWKKDGIQTLCASFSSENVSKIPDAWYQGTQSFIDTFWTVNTESGAIDFITDPKNEKFYTKDKERVSVDGLHPLRFDVIKPLLSIDEKNLVFVNKNDETLWSMKIPSQNQTDSLSTEGDGAPSDLSPSELKDAVGSASSTTITR